METLQSSLDQSGGKAKTIEVRTEADVEKVKQILSDALHTVAQTEEYRLSSVPSQEHLVQSTAHLAAVLQRCIGHDTRCTNRHREEDNAAASQFEGNPEGEPKENHQELADLEAKVAVSRQRVAQMRKEVPLYVSANLRDALQAARPVLEEHQNAGANTHISEESDTPVPGVHLPQPSALRDELADIAQRAPSLRAKLTEAVSRLSRVSAAYEHSFQNGISEEKENIANGPQFEQWLAEHVNLVPS